MCVKKLDEFGFGRNPSLQSILNIKFLLWLSCIQNILQKLIAKNTKICKKHAYYLKFNGFDTENRTQNELIPSYMP